MPAAAATLGSDFYVDLIFMKSANVQRCDSTELAGRLGHGERSSTIWFLAFFLSWVKKTCLASKVAMVVTAVASAASGLAPEEIRQFTWIA